MLLHVFSCCFFDCYMYLYTTVTVLYFFVFFACNDNRENRSLGFLTRSDTNRAVQLQKIVRDTKFGFRKKRDFTILVAKTKGADQLRSYCTADLRLCFRICKKWVFLITRLISSI